MASGKGPPGDFPDRRRPQRTIDLTATKVVDGRLVRVAMYPMTVAGTKRRIERPPLMDRLAEPMTAVTPGPTWHEASRFSPIVSARQPQRIDDIVRRSLAAGACTILQS